MDVRRLPLSFRDVGVLSRAAWRSQLDAAAQLKPLLGGSGIRMVHCGRVLPEGWLAMWCGAPFACFVHGEELNSAGSSRQLTWMARRTMRRARFLIANSRHTRAVLTDRWQLPAARIRLLYPGVDAQRFVPAARDLAARAGLGWGERPVLLTVARLQKRKGHDHMLAAIARLRTAFPNLLYAVAGDGEEARHLAAAADRLGVRAHVCFHGALQEAALLQAYQQCDLFVLPVRTVNGDFEGFGMVLLEAQACGRAVIAGDCGGTREALQPEQTGLLVDCTDVDALARSCAALLRDHGRAAAMGHAGRRWAAHFDFDARRAEAQGVLGIGAAA